MTSTKYSIFKLFELSKIAFGSYKWQIILMMILSFLTGILEAVGINAIIPIFSVIDGGETTDIISQTIEKFFLYFGIFYSVKFLLIFIATLFIIRAIVLLAAKYITLKIAADYERNTRSELFKLMLESNWSHLLRQKLGYLDQVLIMDIKNCSSLLAHIGGATLILINLIVYTFVAFNISFTITMLALALGAGIFLVFKPFFYKTRILSQQMAEDYKSLAHYVNENIIGMKAIKSMLAENVVFNKGVEYFDHLKDLRIRAGLLRNFTYVAVQPIGLLFIIGIFAFFYKTGSFTFASFIVIVYAINRIFVNIQSAQSEAHIISSFVPYLTTVLNYRKEAMERKEEDMGTEKFNFKDRLELKNINFSYDTESTALSDISFSVKRGEMIGIIGPSGAGKTTLVDLLLRLFNPQKGAILLDGKNITDISLKEWRNNVGYVSQDIFLINDTLENNIRFYNESLSKQDIIEATKMANIYDFIQKQPQGFDTVVGERGIKLSGGQRQRIVLARTLARHPQILILDEATSALDSESEVSIQQAIEKIKGEVTVIAIAHRLSTVINSDRLVVIEDGRVIESGTPKDLLEDKKSYFFKAYNLRK